MKTKIEIKSILGNVLFEFEKENNTVKDTIEEAIKQCANLSSANLYSANLYSANLSSANLSSANLEGANLEGANLSSNNTVKDTIEEAIKQCANLSSANLLWADLEGANLGGANLLWANLYRADLSGANLEGANLGGARIPIFCKWPHSIVDGKIKIGCKVKSIEEWETFFNSAEVYATERNTQDFKQIRAVFESYKAYLNVLNS
jgi:hypothetical protein